MGEWRRFGQFELNVLARELRCGGELRTVSPKVFDCIVYLMEHRDRSVGHGELSAVVWGRADVSDVQLRQLMRKVRRVLGDDGGRQSVIRTIPRFGFRWIAAVQHCEPPQPERAASVGAPPRRPALTLTRRVPWAAVACLCLVLAFAGGDSREAATMISVAAPNGLSDSGVRGVLAVLPVNVGTSDPDDVWIRLGLMDLIASHLRRAALRVVPSSDIVVLARDDAGGQVLIDRVRSVVRAGRVVVPSVTRRGDLWNVQLELAGERGAVRSFEARSADITLAASNAADLLLESLGRAPHRSSSAEGERSLSGLLHRVEGAMLVDDYQGARRLASTGTASFPDAPELQLVLARIDIAMNEKSSAVSRLLPLLDEVTAERDPALRAAVLTQLGTAQSDDRIAAERRLGEAIALLESVDHPEILARACRMRGVVLMWMRRFEEARADFARARAAADLSGDALMAAQVDNSEAVLEQARGRPAESLPLLEHAAEVFERFGALSKLANPLLNRIGVNLEMLNQQGALAAYEDAAVRLNRLEDPVMRRWLRLFGAEALAVNGRLREARQLVDDVLRTSDTDKDKDAIAAGARLRAEIDFAATKLDSAAAFAARSIETVMTLGHGYRELSQSSLVLTRILRTTHKNEEAKEQSERLLRATRHIGAPATQLRVRLAQAEQAWASGERVDAARFYQEALDIADSQGTALDLAEVTRSYGNALLDAGDLPTAVVVIGRAARWVSQDFFSAILVARLYQSLGQRDAWRSALDNAQRLAGERTIPAAVSAGPKAAVALSGNP